MGGIVELMTTIGIFIGALIILVFVHELGHFVAAKFFGMRVERFSVGFPPRIWGFQRGETDYCLGATPLGGYVKISGMIDESMDTEHLDKEPEPWEFRSKPVWQRIITIIAGVIFNMILAVFIFAGMGMASGEYQIPNESVNGIFIADSSLAARAGFETGDKLLAVNGEQVENFEEFFTPTKLTASELNYTVIRNGQRVEITMPAGFLDELNDDGFIGPRQILPSQISSVISGSPAEEAGLQSGDKIVAVNGDSINYFLGLVAKIESSEGSLLLTIERERSQEVEEMETFENQNLQQGRQNSTQLRIEVMPEDGTLGIAAQAYDLFNVQHIQYGFIESIGYGIDKTSETFTGIIQGFQKLFSGDISVRQNLGGPVAIANITQEATDRGGWLGFWSITAFLSVTLAIMNILPIPALDGGHLMFLIYEGITRREPSEKVRMALQQIGFVIIIGLFILVTFNDILRLF